MTADSLASHGQTGPPPQAGGTPQRAWAATAAALWRNLLFGTMALLCLDFTVVHLLHHAANPWYVSPLLVAGALAAWFNPVLAALGFVVVIPLLNGTGLIWSEPSGNPWNVVFSGIFLAWYIKRAFVRGKRFDPVTSAAVLADILSTAVLCSLLILLLGYPRPEIVPAIFREIALNQYVLLYSVQAAAVLTQGVFLFRLIELEAGTVGSYQPFAKTVLIVAAIVVGFSVVQFAFDVPVWRGLIGKGKRGLFSPFDDIHSYGSTIVLLFSVVLSMAIGGRGRSRVFHGIAAVLLAACAVYSLSRATWVALLVVAMVSVWQLRRRQAIALTAGIVLAIVLAFTVLQTKNFQIPSVPLSAKELASPAILSMRFYQWNIAGAMIRDVPLSGVGIGSLLRLFPFYSDYDPAVDGAGPYAVRAPANAHNYFVQLAAELGIPALAVFLILLAYAYRSAFGRLASEPDAKPFVRGLMVGVGGYLLTCLTGHPLLLPAQQFVFWFAVAALAVAPGRSPDDASSQFGRPALATVALLGAAMIAGYAYRAHTLQASTGYAYGLYPPDTLGNERIEWTKKDARIRLRATSNLIEFRVIADRHNVARGLGLTLAVDGAKLEHGTIFEPGAHEFSYYVAGMADRTITVQLSVSRTFNPKRLGLSDDPRDLGVALAPIVFRPELPKDGVGFHPWERTETRGLPLDMQQHETDFRWTRKQATVPLRGRTPESALRMLLCAWHPDISAVPVSVEILADGRVVRIVALSNTDWQLVEVPADAIRGAQALTLRVDRTWNPRREGVSDDPRDIGVGVVLR
jgi:O-antigen ligase